MAAIVIFDPADTTVAGRVMFYDASAHTPAYDSEVNKLVNPSLTAVAAVAEKYWKHSAGAVVEMTQTEKDAVDALPPLALVPRPVSLSNVKLDEYKNLAITSGLGIGGGFRKVTHNFCDPRTWWQESSEHLDQVTTTGDDLTYDVTNHADLIDIRHKRLPFEDKVDATTVAPNGSTMTNVVPVVKLNGVALVQTLEDDAANTDRYTVDYVLGKVAFSVARLGTDVVTVSFRKAGSSKCTVEAAAGKKLVLQDAELDVSENVDMKGTFQTETFGSHSVQTGGAVVSLDVKTYKTMHDFQAAARRFWGPLPANFGGVGGIASPKWSFEWQYERSDELFATPNYRDLNVDAGLITLNRSELSLLGDMPYGGDFLTITFYGFEVDEAG